MAPPPLQHSSQAAAQRCFNALFSTRRVWPVPSPATAPPAPRRLPRLFPFGLPAHLGYFQRANFICRGPVPPHPPPSFSPSLFFFLGKYLP